MVTKGTARVLHAEQPTPLQDWHDLLNKIVEGSGEPGWHKVEPVGRACHKPLLQAIGNELWCTAQESMPHSSSGKVAEFT